MFMAAIEDGRKRARPCPADFDEIFVSIGRLACEEHYAAGRIQINKWMEERGFQRLIDARTAKVAGEGKGSPRSPATKPRITRQDMAKILTQAYPVRDNRRVNPNTARHAAQFLRINRNGGFIVSQCPDGDWRIGTRKVSAAQLVDAAKAKGFKPN